MLHITNGRSVELREAGVGGDVVYWDDVLHEGPVPRLPLEELSELRAHFLAQAFGRPQAEVEAQFAERDEKLRCSQQDDELVLWFEHDLYDQLQLIQILAYLAGSSGRCERVSLVQADSYLGPMRPEQLAALFPSRRPVSDEQLRLAAMAWSAFTAPEPGELIKLLSLDLSALPYLRPAMRRHLEQFPWIRDGLSRTERQILQVVARGARTFGDAFRADTQLEEPRFMGDATYALHVRELGTCRRPLLLVNEHGTVMKITLHLTSTGRDVLEGRADHVKLSGIDRWLGGIHLSEPEQIWRYDGATLRR